MAAKTIVAKTKNGRVLTIGAQVAYSVDFLKSISESHGPMAHARGEIVAFDILSDDCILADIKWSDDKAKRFKAPISYTSYSSKVNCKNLAIVGLNEEFSRC